MGTILFITAVIGMFAFIYYCCNRHVRFLPTDERATDDRPKENGVCVEG